MEREYPAWARGYVSGLIIRAPQGVDEDLKLISPEYPIQRQMEFLSAYCRKYSDNDYVDGVEQLYRALRKSGS